MSEKLKNCPFCGGEATLIGHLIEFHGPYVECSMCEASGPLIDVDNHDDYLDVVVERAELKAIDAWNSQSIPEGYVLVPVEPTDKIILGMAKEIEGCLASELNNTQGYELMADCEESYRALIEVLQGDN